VRVEAHVTAVGSWQAVIKLTRAVLPGSSKQHGGVSTCSEAVKSDEQLQVL